MVLPPFYGLIICLLDITRKVVLQLALSTTNHIKDINQITRWQAGLSFGSLIWVL
jgi:hypothetical protein